MDYFPDELVLYISDTLIELKLLNKKLDFTGLFLVKDSYRTDTSINYYGEDIFGNYIFISHPHKHNLTREKTEICLAMGSTDYYYTILPTYIFVEGKNLRQIAATGKFITFKKEEYVRQMTLSEVEQELGYKIQLVVDDE